MRQNIHRKIHLSLFAPTKMTNPSLSQSPTKAQESIPKISRISLIHFLLQPLVKRRAGSASGYTLPIKFARLTPGLFMSQVKRIKVRLSHCICQTNLERIPFEFSCHSSVGTFRQKIRKFSSGEQSFPSPVEGEQKSRPRLLLISKSGSLSQSAVCGAVIRLWKSG